MWVVMITVLVPAIVPRPSSNRSIQKRHLGSDLRRRSFIARGELHGWRASRTASFTDGEHHERRAERQDADRVSSSIDNSTSATPHTLTSPLFPPKLPAYGFNAISTSSLTNLSTCSGHLPINVVASSNLSSSGTIGAKNGVRRMRSMRSLLPPSTLTLRAASWERTRICSWASWRETERATRAMMMFSLGEKEC